MNTTALLTRSASPAWLSGSALPQRRTALRCRAERKPEEQQKSSATLKQLALAGCLAGSLLLTSAEPALAARSGGRAGGSSGFRSAAPSRPAPSAPRGGGGGGGSSVRNYNYYGGPQLVAPPLVGGYGGYGGGYGYGYGGGISLFPSFLLGGFGLGGFFNLIAFAFVASLILNVVRSIGSRKDDDFDD